MISPNYILGLILLSAAGCGGILAAYRIYPSLKRRWMKGKVLRALAEDKRKEDAQKKLDEIKKESQPVSVDIPAVPLEGEHPDFQNFTMGEIDIGKSIPAELTKIIEKKRIIVVRGRIRIKANWLGRLPNLLFFVWQRRAYFVKANKIIQVEQKSKFKRKKPLKPILKLVYDILYSEALDKDGNIDWDEDLEMILVDSAMDQYITVATFETGFSFTPALKTALIIIAVMGTLLGLGLNGALQLTPTIVVHWLPR